MALAYAIHSIHRQPGKVKLVHPPKSMFELSDAEFDELAALGAVRPATDNEATLYRASQPKAAAPKPTPAAAKTPEKAPEPAAAGASTEGGTESGGEAAASVTGGAGDDAIG